MLKTQGARVRTLKIEHMEILKRQLDELNTRFRRKSPQEIVHWTNELNKSQLLTTNFGPYSGTILHLVSRIIPEIPVIWCDTGYNTPYTYRHVKVVQEQLSLNVHMYAPRQTAAWREVEMGIPDIDDVKHRLFTEQVKLEPFRRAMREHAPQIWYANLRKGQTAHRDSLDIFSLTGNGILKVSPFYYWTDKELDNYLTEFDLTNEHRYWDPTKVLEKRECGLHT